MRYLATLCLVLAVSTLGVTTAQAQDLNPGDQAPPFSLPGSDGMTHDLASYAGKTVILAWFPKAFTGG